MNVKLQDFFSDTVFNLAFYDSIFREVVFEFLIYSHDYQRFGIDLVIKKIIRIFLTKIFENRFHIGWKHHERILVLFLWAVNFFEKIFEI